MNPYDFVRIDWNRVPERRCPIWHNRLVGPASQRLYAGQLEVDIFVEKPLFVSDPRSVSPDPKKPAQSIQNAHGDYIIPGSSLKGMLRGLVETLGNGCLTLFDGDYERRMVNYSRETPHAFQHCDDTQNLCIACRTFGMLKERGRGVFLGKVNIGDAIADKEKVYMYDPIYTKALMEPKPHHASFYLDEDRKRIAGRKYYFHHSPDQPLETTNGYIYRNGRNDNRYIQPLDAETQFRFRIDFTNLESDELGALLLAIALEENVCHKIGYAKPLGLGTMTLYPARLTLIDFAARYTRPDAGRGKTVLEGNELLAFTNEHITNFHATKIVPIAMADLRRIWSYPPKTNVDYYYPSKRDWFDTPESRGKRIKDTIDVP